MNNIILFVVTSSEDFFGGFFSFQWDNPILISLLIRNSRSVEGWQSYVHVRGRHVRSTGVSTREKSSHLVSVVLVSAGWSPVSLRHCGGRADDCPHCPRSSCHQSLVLLSRPGGRPGVGAALSTPALTALRVTTRARQTHILMFFILWDWHLFDCPHHTLS